MEKIVDNFCKRSLKMLDIADQNSVNVKWRFGEQRSGVNLFTLTLEREKGENYEKYTGNFVCDKKNLKVVATRGEFGVVMLKSEN